MHAYIHTFIHTYIHTYLHTYIHTYIHTYSHCIIDGVLTVPSWVPFQAEAKEGSFNKRLHPVIEASISYQYHSLGAFLTILTL